MRVGGMGGGKGRVVGITERVVEGVETGIIGIAAVVVAKHMVAGSWREED